MEDAHIRIFWPKEGDGNIFRIEVIPGKTKYLAISLQTNK